MHGRARTSDDTYIEVSPPVSDLPARVVARFRRETPPTATSAQFAAAVLKKLGIEYRHDPAELEAVPRNGRVIFIANHPFGALDGLMAMALLGALRPDLKVFANEDLRSMCELEPMLLPIEVFGQHRSNCNARAMRNALRWLEREGALMVFPAGDVSHFDARARCITDPPWSRAVALLARKARADIVPVHFTGENGLAFQIAGFLHPRLRSLLLPRELKRRAGSSVPVRIGTTLPFDRLRAFESDEALTAHLRVTTYLLARRPVASAPISSNEPRRLHPLAYAGAPADFAGEIARLPESARLVDVGDSAVYCATADAIPHLLEEIGRLREESARAAGEGTGRARDIDPFDEQYEHLVLWNRRRERVAGALRIGRIDEIRKRHRPGLHVAGQFHFRSPFFQLLGPALELGRSFLRFDRTPGHALSLTLWKGVGEYLARNPRYFRLLGSVRIGGDYQELSQLLLVEFLRSHCLDSLLAKFVRPAHPLTRGRMEQAIAAEVSMLGHLDALAELVEDIEPDRKGVPMLLRQYLGLGGRVVEFNADPDFGQTIDCLFMVDVRQADPRVLARYVPGEMLGRLSAQRGLRVRRAASA